MLRIKIAVMVLCLIAASVQVAAAETWGNAKVVIDGRVAVSAFLAEKGDASVIQYDVAPVIRWLEVPKYWAGSEIGLTFGEDSKENLIESVFLNAVFDIYKYEYATEIVRDLKIGFGLFGSYDFIEDEYRGGLTASGYFF